MTTIRQLLARRLLTLLFALCVLGGLGVYLTVRAALLREFDDALLARAGAITSATDVQDGKVGLDVEDQAKLDASVKTALYELWSIDGKMLYRSKSLGASDLPRHFPAPASAAFSDVSLPSGTTGRVVELLFTPENSDDEKSHPATLAPIIIAVASDRGELDRTLTIVAVVLAGFGILTLATTAYVVPRVLRRGLAPLDQLARRASEITVESLTTRFPTAGLPGELLPISSRLNDLLARLETSFERERNFSADVAHELRTPIAELRSLVELTLRWPDDPAARNDREILAVAVQMEGVVTRLLALLRSDRGQVPLTPDQIDAATLTAQIWRPFADRIAAKSLRVASDVPSGSAIKTDPVLLRSILTALADNAVEYTPAGGEIHLEVQAGPGRFSFRMMNTNAGIDTADIPRLFDRFWRKDAARSGVEHAGLGLSLARSYARALGGDLTAEIDVEGRICFNLLIPSSL